MYGWLRRLSDVELAAAYSAARAAFLSLSTGAQVSVAVDMNGDRAEFTQINRAGLLAYLNALEAETTRRAAGLCASPGPIRFVF